MANSQDVIRNSSQAQGFDMVTGKRKVFLHPSPAQGVDPVAIAGSGGATEAYPGAVIGTGSNTDTYFISAED